MNQMKQIYLTIVPALFALSSLFSCSDMLDTDSSRLLPTDKNTLQSRNDSLYSMLGIWAQMSKLADRYVLLGELRGELMDLTDRADANLHAIADFDYSQTPDNKYISQREYYAVINNCNYFLKHADTTRYTGSESTLKREWVAIKAYRAWTYMQLALNYGEAVYLEEPLLTVDEVNEATINYKPISRDEIFRKLIEDLLPYVNWEVANSFPQYGEELNVRAYCYIHIFPLVGDLFLWLGHYEEAAMCYRAAMAKFAMPPLGMIQYTNKGFETGNDFAVKFRILISWIGFYLNAVAYPNLTLLPLSQETELPDMTAAPASTEPDYYKLMPSQAAIDTWNTKTVQLYRDDTKAPYPIYYYESDARGLSRGEQTPMYYTHSMGSYINRMSSTTTEAASPVILKYGYGRYVCLLRVSTLYLRYAEALNNLGKPASAFTVLKYGVDDLTNPARNNIEEVTPLPTYCDFSWISENYLEDVVGIHAYGSGDLEYDTIYYKLPDSTALSVYPEEVRAEYLRRFVEEKILDEYALETAFEGNRFHDLMRFSLRNKNNAILADRVALRNPELRGRLMDEKNWYLPKNSDE
jgi:hypothetical protein